MIGNSVEIITTSVQDIKNLKSIPLGCKTIYTTPDLVQELALTRSLQNDKYNIYAMVDFPKGSKDGTDKFKGMDTNFFLVDGYDIVLNPSNPNPAKEIEDIHSFIKQMVSNTIDICYTINVSMREESNIIKCAKSFFKNKPTKIKLESQPTLQPTKANLEVHKKTIEILRKYCTVPIVISGNINKKIYDELAGVYKIGMSLEQCNKILQAEKDLNNKGK
jgi:hypothetical protein